MMLKPELCNGTLYFARPALSHESGQQGYKGFPVYHKGFPVYQKFRIQLERQPLANNSLTG